MPSDDAGRLYAEVDAAGGPVEVPAGAFTIRVPPVTAWPPWVLDALRDGDFEAWAETVLDDDSFAAWAEADLTVDGCETFLDDWSARSGQDLRTILRLSGLIEQYARQVEGDLWHYYQRDLRDLWQPNGGRTGLTWRLLDVLFDRLPGESATKTAIRDDMPDDQLAEAASQPRKGHGPWSRSDLLTADVIDLLKWLIFATYAVQGGKPKQPEPYPRPGVRGRRRIAPAQLAYLQRLRDEHAQLHGYDIE